ncbi:cysteine--tRNA ligase [Candidatus Uhrbacteria bacterium]|nr:cysteine--tRNA ligase [Candidatus Uhrbacteria bacterium]
MLKLYNSYTRRKENFRPRTDKQVAMYNCGPTVYDYAHIGNLRSFLTADVLRRYLEYRGYKVRQVMNITDVGHMTTDADFGEDKMSVAMRREGKGPLAVARFYEQKFFEDIDALKLRRASKYPRATEHVKEMVALTQKLLKRKHAYLVPEQGGSSVYYDLSTFPNYGKLSGNRVEDLIAGARVETASGKRNPYDFALWIFKPKHFLQWKSPWGAGYPGWHLECSAMAMKYLGETLDIHTGGEDNKFPHHECEIAQSEGATGKTFARFWLHAKHLLVDGKKMAKSARNFYTLRDLLQKGYTARQVRYALTATHYREALNFTFQSLTAAKTALARVDELAEKLSHNTYHVTRNTLSRAGVRVLVKRARAAFIEAMDDDLNVSKARGVLFDFVRRVNTHVSRIPHPVSQAESAAILKLLKEIDDVLGLGIEFKNKRSAIPAAVYKLVEEREAARRNKDWTRADNLRAEIEKSGYHIEDAAEGPRIL